MHQEFEQQNMPNRDLLPHIIDQRAENDPHRAIAAIPVPSPAAGYTWCDVTYQEFSNAINGAAWLIHKELGSTTELNTLAYIGPNDLRYAILVLAAVKAGFKLLLVSPRNIVAGNLHLFQATNVTALLTTKPPLPPVTSLLDSTTIKSVSIPDLGCWLYQSHAPFIYEATFAQNLNDPLVILHTSGSTGLPKPITWTHGFVDAFQAAVTVPTNNEEALVKQEFANARVYNGLPLFHVSPISKFSFHFMLITKGCWPWRHVIRCNLPQLRLTACSCHTPNG